MLEIVAIYFAMGFLLVGGVLFWGAFFGPPPHHGYSPWAIVTFLIAVCIWPFLTFVLITGEVSSRRVYAKADREQGGSDAR